MSTITTVVPGRSLLLLLVVVVVRRRSLFPIRFMLILKTTTFAWRRCTPVAVWTSKRMVVSLQYECVCVQDK